MGVGKMTKNKGKTLAGEIQYIADFYVDMHENKAAYGYGNRDIEKDFAEDIMRAVNRWLTEKYGNPKHVLNKLVEILIDKDVVTLFMETLRLEKQLGSDQK